jgi:hypothetical protein
VALTPRVGTEGLNLLNEIGALGDFTEHNVLAVQPGGDNGSDEELRTVGVGPGVGHGEEERSVVSELEVLIGELVAVDGLEGISEETVNQGLLTLPPVPLWAVN